MKPLDHILLQRPWLLSLDNVTDHMWGGHWIRAFKGLPASVSPAGESWELSARPEHPSRVEMGSGISISLPELIRDHAALVLGSRLAAGRAGLPLLTKFIDAADDLSVQVHPSDEQVPSHESGKSESWVILDVESGDQNGFIYLGFNPSKFDSYESPAEFSEAFFAALNQVNSMGPSDDGAVRARAERVVLPFLNRIRVRPGDVFDVRPGTIHAIGRGVRLFEIQQASDITYRVWDWNRPDLKEKANGRMSFRPLHVTQARAVLDFRSHVAETTSVVFVDQPEQILTREEEGRFLLTQINLRSAAERFALNTNGVFQALTVVNGEVEIGGVRALCGRSVLFPAAMERVVLSALRAPAAVLRSTVPV